MEYIMLYHDFLETTQALTDAERGRLIVAMVEFARDGRADESALVGNERVLFPVFRRQIERDARAYESRVQANSRNGKKGGRPKKPGKTQNNPSVSAESEKSQEKEKDKEKEEYKDKEKEKDKYKDKDKEPGRGCAEAPHAPALDEVLDYCRENGMSVNGETFWNFYQAVGWQVGSRPIRDWRAQLRVWASRESQGTSPARGSASALGAASARNNPARAAPFPPKASADNPALNYAQRSYSDDDSFFIDLDAYAARTQT
jgi:hypothetical protein